MKSFETVSAELKKVKANNVVTTTVRNINVTDMTTWQRVSITLKTPVKGYVADEEGNYSEGEVNVIFVSSFSVIAAFRNNPKTAFAGNYIAEHPNCLQVLLSGAKIEIVQEAVTEGQEYINPWSSNPTPTPVEHDSYYNHITNIMELSDISVELLKELARMIMFG